MEIDNPEMEESEVIADLWVDLAREQYEHGSYLAAEENRIEIHDSICQHIVSGDLLVARFPRDESQSDECDIVGFVMFTPETGRYEETRSIGLIENLYVIPEYRNEGLGATLLAKAEERLSAADVEIITLDLMAQNEAARRFYVRHGYTTQRETMAKGKHENDIH